MLCLQLPVNECYTDASDDELAQYITPTREALGDRFFALGHHYQGWSCN